MKKIIHYCWFGGKPLPELACKCIQSWKSYFPGYEIKEWNESNFDVHCCAYVEEAYKAKRWAFVSDYARFQILYRYGGFYFDTDVEVISPFEDIIRNGSFMGTEYGKNGTFNVAPGLGLYAEPGNKIYKKVIDAYMDRHFILPDGAHDKTTVVTFVNKIMKQYGFNENDEAIQNVNGLWIYPPEYFCPLSNLNGELNITKNSKSIHHYQGSWLTDDEIKVFRIKRYFTNKGLGSIGEVTSLPYTVVGMIKNIGIRNTINRALNHIIYKTKGGGVNAYSIYENDRVILGGIMV